MTRILCCLATVILIGATRMAMADDENLNQKFGPGWSCSMMSLSRSDNYPNMPAVPQPTWDQVLAKCDECEKQRQDFVVANNDTDHPSGYCTPRK